MVLGLHVHDAYLASVLHHEPFLRHDNITRIRAAPDDIFNAKSSEAWYRLVVSQEITEGETQGDGDVDKAQGDFIQLTPHELAHKPSHFTGYVILQRLLARICEDQRAKKLEPNGLLCQKYFNAIQSWRKVFMPKPRYDRDSNISDTFCLTILWHHAFLNLLTDFDVLERAVGRDGLPKDGLPGLVESDIDYAKKWAASLSAPRTILHVVAIQRALGSVRLGDESPIHVPHCLFIAGISCYCFTLFRQDTSNRTFPNAIPDNTATISLSDLDFPELVHFQAQIPSDLLDSLISHNCRALSNQHHNNHPIPVLPVGVKLLLSLADTLQRIGHWGIARKFALVLATLSQIFLDEFIN